MGLIIKESFNQTVLRIIISFVSAVAVIFIYPLNRELYGVFGYILNTSALLVAIVVLGLGLSSIRFFPFTSQNRKSRLKFFLFILRIFCINASVFVLSFYFLKDLFVNFSNNPSARYEDFIWHICIGALLFSIVEVLVKYLSNYKTVAVPVALQTVYKLATPLAFILVYFRYLDLETGIWIIFGVLFLSLIGLSAMTFYKLTGEYNSSSKDVNISNSFTRKSFFSYYFWAFASSAGSLIAFRIDGYMVPALTTFKLNGDYSMAMFITTVITIPISAVVSIAHPLLSQAWKDNNIDSIKNIYLKGSENLIFIGSAMLLSVFLLLDFLPIFFEYLASFSILDDYKSINRLSREWNELKSIIKLLVLILGVSRLFDMASSVNGVIIQHSQWYRHNTYYILIMVVVNVVLNYTLMEIAGLSIMGAAIATTISLILFNVMKTILIYIKINIHPFTNKMMVFIISFCFVIFSMFYLQNWIGEQFAFVANKIISLLFLGIWLFHFEFAEDTKNSIISLKKKWF